MSTKAERACRSQHKILPIKVKVPQQDGSVLTQWVDADVRIRKPSRAKRKGSKS